MIGRLAARRVLLAARRMQSGPAGAVKDGDWNVSRCRATQQCNCLIAFLSLSVCEPLSRV